MALLQHGTVKFNDKVGEQSSSDADPMTLVQSASEANLRVYFSSTPFERTDLTIREVISTVATLTPQPVSVVIDQRTCEAMPELPLAVQAYFAAITDIAEITNPITTHLPDTDLQTGDDDVVLCIGTGQTLNQLLEADDVLNQTIVYLPDSVGEQMALHRLLSIDTQCTIVPVINAGAFRSDSREKLALALLKCVDISLAADSQFFHWIEGNANQLLQRQSDAMSMLVARYCSLKSEGTPGLLAHDSALIDQLLNADAGLENRADCMAALIALKIQLSVLHEKMPGGADARLLFLFQTLGFSTDKLQKDKLHPETFFQNGVTTLLNEIGELSSPVSLTSDEIQTAIGWLTDHYNSDPVYATIGST